MSNATIFRKTIDWSCLNWGFTIPLKSHQKFHDYNGKKITRGNHEEITLLYNGVKYKGVLRNVNRKKVKNDTLQIIYSADSEFLNLLRKVFRSTFKYVNEQRAEALKRGSVRPNIKIPPEIKEYFEIHRTGRPFEFEIKLIPCIKDEAKPKEIADLKIEIEIIESKKVGSPCLPALFAELDEISRGKVNEKKYAPKSAAALFEDLIFYALYTLGYDESKQFGYKMSGKKRGHPDGELKSHNTDYLVIYDAKERKDGYSMNTSDRRAMEDYVRKARVKNFKKVYCLIISSKFNDYPRSISGCPLTYLTAKNLQQLISLKIQNPEKVNPLALDDFFSQGILIEDDDLKNWVDEYDLEMFDLGGILKELTLNDFLNKKDKTFKYK